LPQAGAGEQRGAKEWQTTQPHYALHQTMHVWRTTGGQLYSSCWREPGQEAGESVAAQQEGEPTEPHTHTYSMRQ
jgi:hypothetical protein